MHLPKEKIRKIAGNGILVLAFVIPSGLYALDLVVLAVIGVCRILLKDFKLRASLKEPRIFLPILFYCYIFLGFFFTHNKEEALSSWSEKLPWLLYPLIIGGAAVQDRKLLANALRVFVISICLSMLLAFAYAAVDVLTSHNVTIQLGESIYNKFSWYGLTRVFDNWHPTQVSIFCNLAIAILLHYGIQGEKWFFRKYSYLIAALIFLSLCVFALYSLTEIIVWGCLLLFFTYRWARHKHISLAVILGSGVVAIILLTGILYANPMAMDKIKKLRTTAWHATDRQDERNVLTMRMAKWETHADIFQKHFLWGTTVGDIRDIRKQVYTAKGYTDLATYNYNAHNEYLEVMATYGIVGALLFLSVLWTMGARWRTDALISPFLLILLIAFTTECILERQQGLNFFLFFYSLLTLPGGVGNRLRLLRD
jgi:O-antigen ligase